MKIRRILATAVATAVTAPVLMLSAGPAFAEGRPASQTQEKPSIAELEKAATAAKKVYDEAVEAESAAEAAVELVMADSNPLALDAAEATAAAADAATAKAVADQTVLDARAVLDALSEESTDQERADAETALTEAEAAAAGAATAKTAADAEAGKAVKARDDERVAVLRALHLAQNATEAALADKKAADAALAKAEEEAAGEGEDDEDCVPTTELTTEVTGLPSTVVAGTKVTFGLRVTNGTGKTLDEVFPFVYLHATDRSGRKVLDDLVHLQWSSGSSAKWQNVDNENYIDPVSALKSGAHVDVKLRLSVDASAPAGNGVTFVAGDYWNEDGSCGGSPDLEGYEFLIAAAGSKPGKVEDAVPAPTGRDTADLRPQGAASAVPVGGSLAATGSSSATQQLALASGAALAIGAGAVFAVRRRKDGSRV
ncbi:LAETG motif-containing sortase-dependent surface protein [Streptomyces sp. NPDC006296]|uniref:LAETG motif-containing sortase-dependent surface protein n=1 Tax=Streptomyces sp. NPDC006296 TaxID=3156746 RepID=UPI0033AFCF3B